MELEVLKNFGLVTFVVVSVLGGCGTFAWALFKHFTKTIQDERKERVHLTEIFTSSMDRVAQSIHTLVDRNTIEHKDITEMQGEILSCVRRRRA